MSCRLSLPASLLLLAIALSVQAQNPPQPPSPLDLVRGLREAGMADLAVEYLREIENKPMAESDRQAIPLERARCLLDAADEEPDEGTRTSMIGEAKEAFNEFLAKNPGHPRASEALLAIARLTSLEAKAQLNRSRRIEVPPAPPSDAPDRGEREKERDAALARRRDEAKKAQPLFLLASKRFGEAAKQLKAKLDDKTLEPLLRQSLAQESFDADLAAAINQYNLAETVVAANAAATQERVKYLEEARNGFAKLAKGPPTNRTVWVARAWMAETLMDQSLPNEANAEFDAILRSSSYAAEEGKRLVKFFQVRRAYLAAVAARSPNELRRVEASLSAWLNRYGSTRKPTPEVNAARYYRALSLQLLAELALGPPPKDGKPQIVAGTARNQFITAEKLYRALSQSDNDYTARATQNRMFIVRKLLGEADQPASFYTNFETAQMASLIQIAKLQELERQRETIEARRDALIRGGGRPLAVIAAELKRRKAEHDHPRRADKVLELLERSRALATPQDSPGDVADNLLRLVYFYQKANQPFQAAVLGEHMARTVRSTGGKSAAAGLLGLNGYISAAGLIKLKVADPSRAAEAAVAETAMRQSDRQRAIELARYLDATFPNDVATDAARHRMAILLLEDRQLDKAFDVINRVRAGYSELTNARQLEGYIASQLINGPPDMPLPAGGKVGVYRRATDDLSRVVKPAPNAPEDDVRAYVLVRYRLGSLNLAQSRADLEREKQKPGYDRALAVADEIVAMVPTFDSVTEKEGAGKKLTLEGTELQLLGQDLRSRAVYLRGRALVDGGAEQFPAAAAALQPALEEMSKSGALMTDKMKQWAGGVGDPGDPPAVATQKSNIARLTAEIDKTRRNIVMLGFKLQVRQGQVPKADEMLKLLKKVGGTVADNQSTFELMARELAAPIPGLKKEKRDDEARALGEGVTLLLKELVAIPDLSPSSRLFIGQTLYTVDRHDEALKEFAAIAVPTVPAGPGIAPNTSWWNLDAKLISDGVARKKFQDEVRDYRFAQLYTAKASRGANRVADAEKLLTAAVGSSEEGKRGWAYASYDFRRELALTYEAKARGIADVKAAGTEWARALKEWTTLFQFAQARVKNLPPDADPTQIRLAKSAFFDSYYEIQRVMVDANKQLQAAKPALLTKSLEAVGKKIAEMEISNKIAQMEKSGESIILPEAWNHFFELIESDPTVKNSYKASGGTLFLEKAKD